MKLNKNHGLSLLAFVFVFSYFFIISDVALAATYYVDWTAGSDSNSGRSTGSPWKTLGKVSGFSLNAGDQVLLKRGEVWRETLTVTRNGTSANNIRFGAYGSGANPLILGSNLISSWTQHPENANWWYQAVTPEPEQVFFNRTRGTRVFDGADLNAEGKWYWEGGYLVVYAGQNPTLVWTTPGVEASVRDRAIYINGADYIKVSQIDLAHGNGDGNLLVHNGSHHVTVEDLNNFSGAQSGFMITGDQVTLKNVKSYLNGTSQLHHGVYFGASSGYAADDWLVEKSHFYDNAGAGIHAFLAGSGIARYNFTHDNAQWGIISSNMKLSSNVQIYYNIAARNGSAGIEVESTTYFNNIKVYNNTVFGSVVGYYGSGYGINLENNSLGTVNVYNNVIAKNSAADMRIVGATTPYSIKNDQWWRTDGAVTLDLNGTTFTVDQLEDALAISNPDNHVVGDSAFADEANDNFHLTSSSAGIDEGMNVSLTTDSANNTVPFGSAPDIGAYEFGY